MDSEQAQRFFSCRFLHGHRVAGHRKTGTVRALSYGTVQDKGVGAALVKNDAEGLLAHLENVGTLLEEALKISEIIRIEIHGPEEELNKLREPLSDLKPQYFQLEYGFRR